MNRLDGDGDFAVTSKSYNTTVVNRLNIVHPGMTAFRQLFKSMWCGKENPENYLIKKNN